MPSTERTSVPAMGYLLARDLAGLDRFIAEAKLPSRRACWQADLPNDRGRVTSPNRTGVALVCETESALIAGDRHAAANALIIAGIVLGAKTPLFCGEDWSPDYWEWHLDYCTALAGQAKALGAEDLFRDFAARSRAIVAGLALGTIRVTARKMEEGELAYDGPNKPLWARGAPYGPACAVALAGIRGWTNAVEADGNRGHWSHLVDTARGAAVLLAAGIQVDAKWGGVVGIANLVAARQGANAFWLSDADRATLRAHLANPQSQEVAAQLVEWIRAAPATRYRHNWRRFERGIAIVQREWGEESTAPLVVQAVAMDGTSVSASNHSGQRQSGPGSADAVSPGHAWWESPAVVKATRDDGQFPSWSVDLGGLLGKPLYEIEGGGDQPLVLRDLSGFPSPQPPPPVPVPQPPSGGTPPPSPKPGRPSKRDWIYSPELLGDLS